MPDSTRWVFVEYLESAVSLNPGGGRYYKTVGCHIPESVARQIPQYEVQLNEDLVESSYSVVDMITIWDDHKHDKQVYNQAIHYLASGNLPALYGNALARSIVLRDLVRLYCFGVQMSVEKLEVAVVNEIDSFDDLTLRDFLDTARNYYARTQRDERDSDKDHLALLIKRKLAKFLPQIVDLEMVQEIQTQGRLGRQLVEALTDAYRDSRRSSR